VTVDLIFGRSSSCFYGFEAMFFGGTVGQKVAEFRVDANLRGRAAPDRGRD